MALEPFPGFKSFKTLHCVTGSLRHVYEFHGYPISEEMLLGLGAGIGFMYWHTKGSAPILAGRANIASPSERGLELTVGDRTGVRIDSSHTSSARKAQQALIALLEAGEPVMIYVDMAFLPYFGLPTGYHFGGHAVVAAGYDAERGKVLLSDRDGILHPVTLEVLAQARGSNFKPYPPHHAWYTFDFADKHEPFPEDILTAIQDVAIGMLRPPIANLGADGIRTASHRIREWVKIMDAPELVDACFNAFLFIDAEGGTGGGIFRYMYGRFLKEAAAITSIPRLAELGDDLQEIGDRWQEVARLFRDASALPNPMHALNEAANKISRIADREEDVWVTLHRMFLPTNETYAGA